MVASQSASRFWVTKGICGCSLQRQAFAILVFQIILALITISVGFAMVRSPQTFVTKTSRGISLKFLADKEDGEFFGEKKNWNMTHSFFEGMDIARRSHERSNYHGELTRLRTQGIEIVLGSLVSLGFSIMALLGIRSEKSQWLMPWLALQVIELVVGLGTAVTYIFSGAVSSTGTYLTMILFFGINGYFTYAVISFYILLRRGKEMQSSFNDDFPSVSTVNCPYEQLDTVTSTGGPNTRRQRENTFRSEDMSQFSL